MSLKTSVVKPTETNLAKAAKIIKQGGLVAFPTETVYGLGADALNKEAVAKIYKAKGRPSDNPIIVHLSNQREVERVCDNIPKNYSKLAKKFWPGPLTLIIEANKSVPKNVTANLNTVAVRVPASLIARKLIKLSSTPIAAPSANISGKPSPVTAAQVAEDLVSEVRMIIDGGRAKIGLESTVLDISRTIPTILRPGAITKQQIERVLDKRISDRVSQKRSPISPGMKYRHYAPRAKVFLINDQKGIQSKIDSFTDKKVAVLTTDSRKNSYKNAEIIFLGKRTNLNEVARNLMSALRECDKRNVDVVISETFPEKGIGTAIMNRLKKTAS